MPCESAFFFSFRNGAGLLDGGSDRRRVRNSEAILVEIENPVCTLEDSARNFVELKDRSFQMCLWIWVKVNNQLNAEANVVKHYRSSVVSVLPDSEHGAWWQDTRMGYARGF